LWLRGALVAKLIRRYALIWGNAGFDPYGVLPFLIGPSAPFTNDLAEWDLGMMKVVLRISGCFRTTEGAEYFFTL
jgi:hypothetical protein